ncbi:hypothetical protein ACWGIU_26840 [Streptomyces sp. NPDC054840]
MYRLEGAGPAERAVLARKVGHVVMPRSRVAVLTIPEDVFRLVAEAPPEGEPSYCLGVPGIDRRVT